MRYTVISMLGGAVAVGGNAAQKPPKIGILHEYPWEWLDASYLEMLTATAAAVGIIVGLLGIWKHFR